MCCTPLYIPCVPLYLPFPHLPVHPPHPLWYRYPWLTQFVSSFPPYAAGNMSAVPMPSSTLSPLLVSSSAAPLAAVGTIGFSLVLMLLSPSGCVRHQQCRCPLYFYGDPPPLPPSTCSYVSQVLMLHFRSFYVPLHPPVAMALYLNQFPLSSWTTMRQAERRCRISG